MKLGENQPAETTIGITNRLPYGRARQSNQGEFDAGN